MVVYTIYLLLHSTKLLILPNSQSKNQSLHPLIHFTLNSFPNSTNYKEDTEKLLPTPKYSQFHLPINYCINPKSNSINYWVTN